MLRSVSKIPTQILGHEAAKREPESKPRLPTKRKRETVCGLGSFTAPFSIKPCPESSYDEPATFEPIRIIGRSQLPLTLLDTSPDESFNHNRLFSTSIDVLETQHGQPKVLIARYEGTKKLYAIERVRPCVYSLCKLAWWLKEKEVETLWDPKALDLYPVLVKPEESVLEGAQWWQHAVVKIEPDERPPKRARMSMLRAKPENSESISQPKRAEPIEIEQVSVTVEVDEWDTAVPDIPSISLEPPSPQQLLDTLVQQYLDAVYMSKTSLAYFAKGPVTRVRNAFTSPDEGAPATHELVAFMRSMLLSHKAGEKKYHEKLPEVIRTIPPGSFSDDEDAGPSKVKKSKKKMKLSRDGLYPQEGEIVKKWWKSDLASSEHHGEETLDQRIKRRIGDLRVREALAQMILMLEIIALEALSTYKARGDTETPTQEGVETQAESQTAKPKTRKKKMEDIKLLLDLLLDKLCIWQSVDQDGILDFDAKVSKHGDDKAGGDRLQGFCVEVLVPFYMTRLPEQARMISKKLGGPVQASPSKRKAMRPPATARKSKEPKEPASKKPRRSLSRVATDSAAQSAQRGRAPSLHRSATDSDLVTGIKRETSEVPLAAIPFQRSPSNAARQSMSHLKHLKGRQIDLGVPSAAVAAKLKQKKRVEEDLQEAITALKKPNRGLAVGTYVDDIERRGLGSATKSRKPTTTVRKVTKDVQVTATPRVVRRTKDMVEATPTHHRNPFVRDDVDQPPVSSGFCIPSSAVRSAIPGTVQRRSVTEHASTGSNIAETPSKVPTRKTFEYPNDSRTAIFATPLKRRGDSPPPYGLPTSPNAVFATPIKDTPIAPRAIFSTPRPAFATPTKVASSPPRKTTPPPAPPVWGKMASSTPPRIAAPQFTTPAKPTVTAPVPNSPLPAFSNIANDAAEPSIYDALGWNDDDDFL